MAESMEVVNAIKGGMTYIVGELPMRVESWAEAGSRCLLCFSTWYANSYGQSSYR